MPVVSVPPQCRAKEGWIHVRRKTPSKGVFHTGCSAMQYLQNLAGTQQATTITLHVKGFTCCKSLQDSLDPVLPHESPPKPGHNVNLTPSLLTARLSSFPQPLHKAFSGKASP